MRTHTVLAGVLVFLVGAIEVDAAMAGQSEEARQALPGLSTPAMGERPERAGSATLVPPAGWQRSEGRDVVSFAPPGNETSALHVLPGEELRGDFAGWFQERWRATTSRFLVLWISETHARSTAGGQVLMVGGRLHSERFGPLAVLFYAVAQGARVQPILFVSRDAEEADRLLPVVERMVLESVRLLPPEQQPPARVLELAEVVLTRTEPEMAPCDTPASAAIPEADGPIPSLAGLGGLYAGLRTAPGEYGVTGDHYVIFFDDGTYLWRLPQEGPGGLDRALAQRQYPNSWGTYSLEGERVVMRLRTGMVETGRRDAAGALHLESGVRRGTLFPVASLTGFRFDGVYARERGRFAPIRFCADGSFEDRGALSAVGLISPDGMFVRVAPGRGTYRIVDNTLALTYSDGRVQKVAIFVPDRSFRSGTPPSLMLNRYLLDRLR